MTRLRGIRSVVHPVPTLYKFDLCCFENSSSGVRVGGKVQWSNVIHVSCGGDKPTSGKPTSDQLEVLSCATHLNYVFRSHRSVLWGTENKPCSSIKEQLTVLLNLTCVFVCCLFCVLWWKPPMHVVIACRKTFIIIVISLLPTEKTVVDPQLLGLLAAVKRGVS